MNNYIDVVENCFYFGILGVNAEEKIMKMDRSPVFNLLHKVAQASEQILLVTIIIRDIRHNLVHYCLLVF